MRLVFVGPPGSGKGTQARLLRERRGYTVIGTGDILRDAVKRRTSLGLKVGSCLTSGRLVPDDLVNELVAELFRRDDHPVRWLLDGYPRTTGQAEALDDILHRTGQDLQHVFQFVLPDEEVIRRLEGRRTQEQRSDDGAETVRKRLTVYQDSTDAIVEYYRRKGLLREIDAGQDVEKVYKQIESNLGTQAK
jgi:adenylate kinase